MRLLYVLALLHDAVQALRDCVRRDPDDGTVFVCVGPVRADFGDGWGVACPWFIAMSPQRDDDTAKSGDDDDCAHERDEDGANAEVWIAPPETVRSWLSEVAEGRSVNDVMTELELAEVGEGVQA